MYAFTYHRPANLAEAGSLAQGAEEPKFMSGGQTLIPTLKQRLAQPTDVIDLGRLGEMKGISVGPDSVTIGAGTTHATVAFSAEVQKAIPALAALAGGIGDPQVRNMGTIGGSIANNDPAADYPAGCLGLGATIVTTTREIPADEFFTGMFETALEPGEIVTKVIFPIPERANYKKFPNPASRYAMVGVFVAKTKSGVRVAVTGAASCVFRVPAMEAALGANFSADAIASITVPASDLNSDLHGSADYRAHLIGVMAKRAVADA
jgi:carbon-monoxide dehydrogenase medium subunit